MMDLFTTFAELAGVEKPTDRIIDGVSLVPLLINGTHEDRCELRHETTSENYVTKLHQRTTSQNLVIKPQKLELIF